jgi:carbon monoxide dehydrogenase subunit G
VQLNGEVTIRAPRKVVWDFLTDPVQIAQCAPGVEKVEVIEPDKRYKGIISIGLGSVKARFEGEVEVLELEEPDHAKLSARGSSGGSAADALSEMQLSDGPDGSTVVAWTADVTVSGQLASLASRLMRPVSQKLSNQFYEEIRRRIETGSAGDTQA